MRNVIFRGKWRRFGVSGEYSVVCRFILQISPSAAEKSPGFKPSLLAEIVLMHDPEFYAGLISLGSIVELSALL